MKREIDIAILGLVLLLGVAIGFIVKERYFKDTVIQTEFKNDTLRITDTIYQENIIVQEVFKPIPVKEPVIKKKEGDNLIISASNGNILEIYNYYQDTVTDNNIDFIIKEKVDGEILERETSYNLKVPLLIKDSVFITTNEVKIRSPAKYYMSAGIGFNSLTFGGGIIVKDKHSFGLHLLNDRDKSYLFAQYTCRF